MFEKFIGRGQEKTPESQIRDVVQRELDAVGINQPGIIRAFEAGQKESEDKQLGLSKEQILDIIQGQAVVSSGPIEDTLYGGAENTMNNILSEINYLRKKHQE